MTAALAARIDRLESLDEIRQLVSKYGIALDHRDMNTLAGLFPEDIQDLAPFVLGHRIWLGPHAAAHGLTADEVIRDVINQVPVP